MKPGDVFDPTGVFLGSFIPNCLLSFTGIPYSAKCLWGRLLQFKGKNPDAWPSIEQMADKMQLSESQIKRLTAILVEQKFIRRTLPTGQDRLAHRTTRYQFLWHPCFEGAHIRPSGGSMDALSGGSMDALSTVKDSCVKDSEGDPPTPHSLADRYWKRLGYKRARHPELDQRRRDIRQLFTDLHAEGWPLEELGRFAKKGPKSCGVSPGTLKVGMEKWRKTKPVRSAESEQRSEQRRERLEAFLERLSCHGVTEARWLSDDSTVHVEFDGPFIVIGPMGPMKGTARISGASPLAFQDIADFAFVVGNEELRFEEEKP